MPRGRVPNCIIGNFDIDPVTNCWVWNKSTRGGYGLVYRNYKNIQAHRYFFEMYFGSVPEDLVIHHNCKNRACVNPSHLECRTHQMNILGGNGVAAERSRQTHCKRGHKFTEDNIYWYNNTRICKICARLRSQLQYYKEA